MTPEYEAFLAAKAPRAELKGLANPPAPGGHLFRHQAACVDFGLRAGSSGCFIATGLGKTLIELDWTMHAAEATNGYGLIQAPLSVGWQIAEEAAKWGYDARVIRQQDEARHGINICNYDMALGLEAGAFGACALDESSILKSFTGKTSQAIIRAYENTTFRMSASATPAPNDHMELGQHSAFLGVMPAQEMLMRWFLNDTETASRHWRLKGHAEEDFWDWVASWARMAEMPSDLGGDDTGFILPPLNIVRHAGGEDIIKTDDLFGTVKMSATDMFAVKSKTAEYRARRCAEIASDDEPWVFWCDTDLEADILKRLMPDAGEVRGSHSADKKEATLRGFADGSLRKLITKPSICGFGLNWQHCCNTAFVGRSFSFEAWHQAVRRFWRFGQTRQVNVHLMIAQGEDSIARVIDRKADDYEIMKTSMRRAMARANASGVERKIPDLPTHQGRLPEWLPA